MVYDKNGNITQDGSRRFTYSSYDLVTNITQGGESTRFKYDANRQRFERYDVKVEAGVTSYLTTLYVGGYEKVTRSGGNKPALTEQKLYVGNLVITKRSNNTVDEFYLHKDHQGSTTTITNKSGNVVQQFTYDPWGKQTAAYSHSLLNDYIAPAASKGYTGHEGIDNLNLIHMNGRIYDPTIGRFLQADPHIQAPTDTQSYNRYSYVLNNPMSYTDPSGFFFDKLWKAIKKYWRVIVAAVVTYFTAGAASGWAASWGVAAGTAGNAIVAGGITGFIGGAVATGNLRGALWGAFSGAVFGALGNQIHGAEGTSNAWSTGEQMLAHGSTGGVISVLQGGKFGHGFISAGIMKGIGKIQTSASFGRVMIQTVAGGTVSKLTGGKFANGAITSAMQYVVNEVANVLKSRTDVLEPKKQKPEVVSIQSRTVYSKWIGDPPPGLKAGPEVAWRLVDSSVYTEYEITYVTTQVKTTQDTIFTLWEEDASGNVSDFIGQRVTSETLRTDFNESVHIRSIGIVGVTRLPEGAKIVDLLCIQNNMRGC
ncbi:RHS repeat domain-containing protein [Shewanella indica]|uniref:RHS repeat domain-containing protein n=1 Tax=Shewanella indica TaxID=768528 RepID=UPI000C34B61B|nr:RHS repeat-associated core domain-containing protein [Shewanella indica]GHB05833.1 hypothetical protein GCM10007107_18500 [Shewanella indica]